MLKDDKALGRSQDDAGLTLFYKQVCYEEIPSCIKHIVANIE